MLGVVGINSLDFKSMIMNKLAWFMNMGRQHIYTTCVCVCVYIYILHMLSNPQEYLVQFCRRPN